LHLYRHAPTTSGSRCPVPKLQHWVLQGSTALCAPVGVFRLCQGLWRVCTPWLQSLQELTLTKLKWCQSNLHPSVLNIYIWGPAPNVTHCHTSPVRGQRRDLTVRNPEDCCPFWTTGRAYSFWCHLRVVRFGVCGQSAGVGTEGGSTDCKMSSPPFTEQTMVTPQRSFTPVI
jgi:hypothetical protein